MDSPWKDGGFSFCLSGYGKLDGPRACWKAYSSYITAAVYMLSPFAVRMNQLRYSCGGKG